MKNIVFNTGKFCYLQPHLSIPDLGRATELNFHKLDQDTHFCRKERFNDKLNLYGTSL